MKPASKVEDKLILVNTASATERRRWPSVAKKHVDSSKVSQTL